MKPKKIRTAVIGVGHLGRHHARIYNELPNAELVCVVDVNEKEGQTVAKNLNDPFEKDYRVIAKEVDAVSVVVPTVGHYEVARFFLEKGVHVLVEKPVTETIEQATALENLVTNTPLVLQVGHIERFNPAWLAVREKVINPRYLEIHRLAPFKGRSIDVGVVLDLMIHDIDIVLSIVNDEVVDIRSSGVAVLGKHEDIVSTRVEFKGGCVANLTASRISSKELRKIRIFQPDSYMTLDYKNQSGEFYQVVNGKISVTEIQTDKQEPLKVELADFLSCVDQCRAPKVSIVHGKMALSAALKILKQINK